MLINTYNFWNTFLGPVTKSSNPTHAHVLRLLWAHTPSAHTCTHCSCGWQAPILCLGRAGCPISPLSAMADVGSPALHVPLWLPTLCQQMQGLVRKFLWPQAPWGGAVPCAAPCCQPLARHDAHGEAPPSWGCCHSRVSPLPLLLFMPLLYFFLG